MENLMKSPLSVSFEITNRCMFKCLHCYNRSGEDLIRSELTDEEILKVFKDLANMKLYTFCFCGGEPLLRYDVLIKACSMLKGNCKNINMVTNGYLLDEIKVKGLKKAGIGVIQLSLDGATSETHDYMRGMPSSFSKILKALDFLEKYKMQVNIAFSPTNFNIKEFPTVIELSKKYTCIEMVRIQPLMGLGRGFVNKISPSEKDYRNLLKFISEYQAKNEYPKIMWGDPIDHIIRHSYNNLTQTTFAELKADGGIFASSYLPIVVGNILKYSLQDYWNKGLYDVWRIPLVQEIAKENFSVSSLGNNSLPQIFFDNNITFDLIDDKVFENIENFTLNKYMKGILGGNIHEFK